MNLSTVLAALGQTRDGPDGQSGLLPEEWAASQRLFPAHGLFFLAPNYVRKACADACLPADATDAMVGAARRIADDPVATALAWYGHYLVFQTTASCSTLRAHWPPLSSLLDRDAGLFNVLVVLSNMPALRALYAERAIPPQVARDTLGDVALRMQLYYKEHGYWGLEPGYVAWLRHHMRGELYQLVRLQFQPGPFDVAVRAFRHVTTGTVVALSEDGVRYRADGQVDGAGGVHDLVDAWTARLTLGGDEIVGYPILPTGRALRHEVRLPTARWLQVLAPGDPVLGLHMPPGSPLDFALCGESLQGALEFFPRHYPDQPFRAFACESWLLDPQLETLLPPTSNLVCFQQEVYLLPIPSDGAESFTWVFGHVPADLRQAPRATRLQRAILDHTLAGGHMHAGGCFLLPEDQRWGKHVYRHKGFPW
jgi:GNAT-like C-terminal domain/N-acyltransferase N-terminal domain